MALLGTGLLAPGAQARVEGFQALTPSPVELTAVAADPGSGLVYAQENGGTGFFVYDPRTNAWSELEEAPLESGNNGGATYLGGKIYIAYTGNSTEMSVYDIASDSWTTIDNPLEDGTGDITAGNGRLYMAVGEEFVEYDPATEVANPLADPPSFVEEEGDCGEGFEPWGGLQFDGASNKIYGHEGNGCSGFAVYDIAANTWSELPYVPAVEVEEEGEIEKQVGAVLGSALDPITNTYITYGTYGGHTLYRYDIEAGSWSVSTTPFEVEDGGMAYISLPGIEGIYMVEGESGIDFQRYTEKNATDLSPSMSAGVVGSPSGGEITYSIGVGNHGPERASGVALTDPLPAGTKLLSVGTSQGTCTAASTVTCSLGVLRSGASATVTIKVAAGFGTVTNTATVSTSQAIDTNPANDSATVVSTLAKPAQCLVPKLKGLRLKKAKKALRTAHCKPGKVTHRFSGKVKKGKVVRSGKRRGTVLAADSKVNLSVSRGAKHKVHHKPKGAH